jgi:hypothetical protein
MSASPLEHSGQPPVAVASLVLGILGITTLFCFLGLPLSVAAIATGVLGRLEARRRAVSETMATAGLILGVATLALGVILAAF